MISGRNMLGEHRGAKPTGMPMHARSRFAVQGWVAGILCQVLFLLHQAPAWAATLTLEEGPNRITYETAALLARSDATEIEIPADVAYQRPRRYRAVPLAAVLSVLPVPPGSALEAVAPGGLAGQIPLALATRTQSSVARAWLAVEMTDA